MSLFVTGVPEDKTWSYFPIGLRTPVNNNSDGFAIASAMNVPNVGKWKPGPNRLLEAKKLLDSGQGFAQQTSSQKLSQALRSMDETGRPVHLPELARSQSAPVVGKDDPFRETRGRRWRGSRSVSRAGSDVGDASPMPRRRRRRG